MKEFIEKTVTAAIEQLQNQDVLPAALSYQVKVERCREPKHGDFACNIALMLSKEGKVPPRDLAQKIVEQIPSSTKIAKIEIAGPGFINFFLTENASQQIIKEILNAGDAYGFHTTGKGKRVHLEFVSANPTGPMHVGHGRGAAYGACVANLLTTIGYQVHREYYVNDAGRQMHILTASIWLRYLELYGETLSFPLNGYKGDYVIDVAKALKVAHEDKFCQPVDEVFKDLPEDTEER